MIGRLRLVVAATVVAAGLPVAAAVPPNRVATTQPSAQIQRQIVEEAYQHAEETAPAEDNAVGWNRRFEIGVHIKAQNPYKSIAQNSKQLVASGELAPLFEASVATPLDLREDFARNQRTLVEASLKDDGPQIYVVDGVPTKGNEHASCIAIGKYRAEDGVKVFLGSGTLVAKNLVVTAAHVCEPPADRYFIYVGPDLAQFDKKLMFDVESVSQHDEWAANKPFDDVAALLIKPNADGLPKVKPTRFANAQQIDEAPGLRIVGYGTTDREGAREDFGVRRLADVPFLTLSHKCDDGEPAKRYQCNPHKEFINGHNSGRSTCRGDSGGPHFIVDPDAGPLAQDPWLFAGVTSRSLPVAEQTPGHICGDGGINTRVDPYEQWIRRVPGAEWD